MLSLLILMQCSSIMKLPFLLAPCILYSGGKVTTYTPHLRTGQLCSTSLRMEFLCKLFGILLPRVLSLLSHLFCLIFLFLYVWTYRYYSIFHIIIKYFIFILFLKLFHFGVSVICPTLWNLLNLLEHFFSFWYYKMHPDLFCVFPDLGPAFFPQRALVT